MLFGGGDLTPSWCSKLICLWQGYRSAIKISGPDYESLQKTSLDTSQTIPFGGCHPTLISATITDLAILGVIMQISCFSVQIWILLEKWVQIQVKPSQTEVKPPRFHQYFVFSSPIRKGTNLEPSDLESPQECAPDDTHIIYFQPVLKCSKIA